MHVHDQVLLQVIELILQNILDFDNNLLILQVLQLVQQFVFHKFVLNEILVYQYKQSKSKLKKNFLYQKFFEKKNFTSFHVFVEFALRALSTAP